MKISVIRHVVKREFLNFFHDGFGTGGWIATRPFAFTSIGGFSSSACSIKPRQLESVAVTNLRQLRLDAPPSQRQIPRMNAADKSTAQ